MAGSVRRVIGFLSIALGVAFLGLALFLLTQSGFGKGFFGPLVTGFMGIAAGFNLILQSQGQMD